MTEMIDCGIRMIQKLHRVTLRRMCKAHDIKEGDYVRVYIEHVGDRRRP